MNIIDLAKQAGFQFPDDYDLTEFTNRLERFAALLLAGLAAENAASHAEYMKQTTSAYNVQADSIKRLMLEVEAGNVGLHHLRKKNIGARAERDALRAEVERLKAILGETK